MLNLLSFAKLRFLGSFIMNKLIQQIEKGKPFFEKISRNIYLGAIRDGFLAAMPALSLIHI